MKAYETTPRFRLTSNATAFPRVHIDGAHTAQQFIRQFYSDDISIFESMYILLLDRSHHTIGYAKISQGGVAGTVVDRSIVAKYAIESLASAVILAHNHPSGNLNASEADLQITKQVKEGLSLFGIHLLDHLIITETAYNSLADAGDM
jgi:DNA repair protein RadC